MFDFLQFSLSDMTPYSRQSYFDLIGLYNQAIWPVQIAANLMALWLLLIGFQKDRYGVTTALLILSAAWLWNGWVFHIQYYSSLNWAAVIFGYLFLLQGGILLAVALLAKTPAWHMAQKRSVWSARVVLIFTLLLYPLMGLLEGRTLTQLECFAITPTPTLLATIAVLLMIEGRIKYALAFIPLMWSLIDISFAWTIQLLDAYAIIVVLVIWLIDVGQEIINPKTNKTKTAPQNNQP